MSNHVVILIHSAERGCDVPIGHEFSLISELLVVGRAADADVRLEDASVSRRHLELRPGTDGVRVKSLSKNGTTFINGHRVEPGSEVLVEEATFWAQVGRALLKVQLVPETVPVGAALPIPTGPAMAMPSVRATLTERIKLPDLAPKEPEVTQAQALLTVEDTANPRVWVKGAPMALFPSASRVLVRLCQSVGEVVQQDDLLEAIDPDYIERAGGVNLSQNVSYIRRMFTEALSSGAITQGELAAQVRAASVPAAVPEGMDEDEAALLRTLLTNVRRVGYVLKLPASAVLIKRL